MVLKLAILVLAVANVVARQDELRIELVGNAGVLLTDGASTLLVDLPYESGAFGYMEYDPAVLSPTGTVVSVITHDHADHFDPALFLLNPMWRVIGPPSVTAPLPPQRVLAGDSTDVGLFQVVAVPSPHTADHRSYRIRWRGRVLFFSGDTEEATAVPAEPRLDVLFATPWLTCALATARSPVTWDRLVLYHRLPDGSDQVCGTVELLDQGTGFTIRPSTLP